MPNGHSGGFQLSREELASLLKSVDAQAVIGKLIDGSRPLIPVTAAEALRLLDGAVADVPVEEQDHSFYVIHLTDKSPVLWLMVTAASPLLNGLRERHSNQRRA